MRTGSVAFAAALAVLSVSVSAGAVELPRRKSGVWDITTSQGNGAPGPGAKMCVDEKTDDLAQQLAAGAISCSRHEVRREGDRYVADSVCRLGDSTATTRTVFTGSFSSGYTADIQATYSPPLMGMSEGRSRISARWIGPCKPGQRAGDLMLPNGTTINVFDAPGAPRK